MNGVLWAALGLAVVAATPAGIVYALMRGKAADVRATYNVARKAWEKRNHELHGDIVHLEQENNALRSSLLLSAEEKTQLRHAAERADLHGSATDEARWT